MSSAEVRRPRPAATDSRWKMSPSIAPRSSSIRSSCGSRSSRDASSPCRAGGKDAGLPGCSWRCRASCSRYSGFPPAVATMSSLVLSGSPGPSSSAVTWARSTRLCTSLSGCSISVVAGRQLAAQPGRVCCSSGRARQSSSTGIPRSGTASASSRSSSSGGACWTSSKITTAGICRVMAAMTWLMAQRTCPPVRSWLRPRTARMTSLTSAPTPILASHSSGAAPPAACSRISWTDR